MKVAGNRRRRSAAGQAALVCLALLPAGWGCKPGLDYAKPALDVPGGVPRADRAALLVLARRSLRGALTNKFSRPPMDGLTLTARARRPQGVFVSLYYARLSGHSRGKLRGCTGTIKPERPLFQDVMRYTRAAARADTRTSRVSPAELDQIQIEIAAISPPRKIAGPGEIVLGKHGVIIERGDRRATFLPHVPPDRKWDLPRTLNNLSLKAGLPEGAWREKGTRLKIFTAQVWSE